MGRRRRGWDGKKVYIYEFRLIYRKEKRRMGWEERRINECLSTAEKTLGTTNLSIQQSVNQLIN